MDKVGAAPTQDVAVHLEMFATTHPLELAQGTTRVVTYRELAPNNITPTSPTHPPTPKNNKKTGPNSEMTDK